MNSIFHYISQYDTRVFLPCRYLYDNLLIIVFCLFYIFRHEDEIINFEIYCQ